MQHLEKHVPNNQIIGTTSSIGIQEPIQLFEAPGAIPSEGLALPSEWVLVRRMRKSPSRGALAWVLMQHRPVDCLLGVVQVVEQVDSKELAMLVGLGSVGLGLVGLGQVWRWMRLSWRRLH